MYHTFQTNHGLVRVSRNYHFKYDDGTPYYPFGTTIYEWPFQDAKQRSRQLKHLNQPI